MTHLKFTNRPFEKSINNLVDELIGDLPVLFNEGNSSFSKQNFVPVNITETAAGYLLEVIAPGFNKADFKISVDDKILTISAGKNNDPKNENVKQIRKEYIYRDFKRSFTMDEKTDATGIDASYVNGVLTLNLPNKAEVKEAKKEITIK